jgi:hypothetical protein
MLVGGDTAGDVPNERIAVSDRSLGMASLFKGRDGSGMVSPWRGEVARTRRGRCRRRASGYRQRGWMSAIAITAR